MTQHYDIRGDRHFGPVETCAACHRRRTTDEQWRADALKGSAPLSREAVFQVVRALGLGLPTTIKVSPDLRQRAWELFQGPSTLGQDPSLLAQSFQIEVDPGLPPGRWKIESLAEGQAAR